MGAQDPRGGVRYIAAIDGLRAVAVLSVIVFHLWPRALPGGFTGVDIFFAISGFVVTGSLLDRRFDRLRDLAAYFYARRLMRIMPALATMLLVTIVAAQLFIPDAWLSNSLAQVGRFAFAGLSNVVLAIDTDTYFGPQAGYNPFTHTWSLGVEEQFYLLFPLLLYWHQRLHSGPRPVRWVALLSTGSLLLCALLTWLAPRFAFYLIFTRFWELGAGMLLCLTADAWGPRLAAAPGAARLGFAAGSVALVALGLAMPQGSLFPFPFALLPVLGAAGLIASVCAAPRMLLARLLASRIMIAIGLLSYSLYLWHWPVFVLFRWTTGLDTLALQLAALAIAVVFALASYALVERPLRTNRWIGTARRGRVVAGVLSATLVAGLAGHVLIRSHDRLTLSVTRERAEWYAEPGRALDPGLTHCTLREAKESVARGTVSIWTPENCTVGPAGFRLFVLGDSHALAYAPALRQLAADLGVPVRLNVRAGCPFLKLMETLASRPRCADYYAAAVRDIIERSRLGDVVFLPGLRQTRLTNQFESDRDIEGPHDDRVTPESLAEAHGVLARLAARGARLVIEAPKPLFPAPPFRCSDWFNRMNPICRGGLTMSRPALLARRGLVLGAIHALAADQPALQIWDPFPILCPADPCQAVPGGHPLFFDGDHLSGLGNDLLYPELKAALLAARITTRRKP